MKRKINLLYLAPWMMVISLGMFQFGYAIAMFNIFTKVLFKQYNAEGKAVIDSQDNFNSVVTTMIPLGAAIGSFTGGLLCNLGRRNAIFIVNGVILVGVAITMIFDFWALIIGRLIIGWGAGSFSVISPLFISETSPPEVAGALGALNQFMVTAGIMLADFLGFAVPYESLESSSSINPEVYTTQSWRGVFIVPAGIAIVQTLIILVVFRHDTIKYYIQKGMKENVKRVESLIYKEEAIKPQIEAQHEENESPPNQINNSAENDVENQSNKVENADFNSELKEKVSIVQLFTARYRKAFIVGCLLAVFQQITGINAVIFYSNDIFTRGLSGYESEKSAKIGTMLVGVVNWAAAMSSIPLLTKFGRKTLLIFGQIGIGISLLLLAVFALIDQPIAIKILTLFFVAFFELSIGPILWLYAAEIMTESGMAAASLITWIITIIFGLFTSKFFDLLKPVGVYFTFTGIDILGLVFIIIVIKETKGKSKEELKSLYYTEKKTNSEDIQN